MSPWGERRHHRSSHVGVTSPTSPSAACTSRTAKTPGTPSTSKEHSTRPRPDQPTQGPTPRLRGDPPVPGCTRPAFRHLSQSPGRALHQRVDHHRPVDAPARTPLSHQMVAALRVRVRRRLRDAPRHRNPPHIPGAARATGRSVAWPGLRMRTPALLWASPGRAAERPGARMALRRLVDRDVASRHLHGAAVRLTGCGARGGRAVWIVEAVGT